MYKTEKPMGTKIKVEMDRKNQSKTALISIEGAFDSPAVIAFEKEAFKLIEGGGHFLLLDLEKTNHLDSAALGSLIKLLKKIRDKKGRMAIYKPSEVCSSVFKTVHLNRLIPIFTEENESSVWNKLMDETSTYKVTPEDTKKGLELTSRAWNRSVILYAKGYFNLNATEQFEQVLEDFLEKGVLFVLLNLEETEFLDSSGLGTLFKLFKRLREKNGNIGVYDPKKRFVELFDMVHLSSLIGLYTEGTEEDACQKIECKERGESDAF